MKKIMIKTVALVLAVVSVICLGACTRATIADYQVTPPPEGEQIDVSGTIKFSYPANNEEMRGAANAFIEAFNKQYPNVQVQRDYSDTDPSTRISSGDIGDVFYFAELNAYNYAITQNALMPLEYFANAYGIDRGDVYSGIYDSGVINGHLYYIARDFNQIIFIYNADAVNSKALTNRVVPEWTWTEFLDICAELTDDEYYGATLYLPYAPIFIPFLEAYVGRGRWFNTATKTVDFTSGDTLKAVKEALDAAQKGQLNLMVSNVDGDYGSKESVFNFIVYPSILNQGNNYDSKKVTWDLINLPLFEYPAFGAGSSGWGVFNRTRNPNAAAAFALFFYTAEGQRAYNGQSGGSVPLLASLKEDSFWRHPNDEWSDKNWDACVYNSEDYATVGQFACLLPAEISSMLTTAALDDILSRALNGRQSVEDGFAALETKVNQKWGTLQ